MSEHENTFSGPNMRERGGDIAAPARLSTEPGAADHWSPNRSRYSVESMNPLTMTR